MDELSAVAFTPTETLMLFTICVIFVAVAVASYRRSRCLSGYRIWASLIICLIAAWFWVLWIVLSLVNHRRITREWRAYYTTRVSHAA